MKKILLITLGAVASINTFAEQKPTADMRVNANVQAGCNIIAQDISFGNIEPFKQGQFDKVQAPLELNCSKGISVRIGAASLNEPTSYWGAFMKHETESDVFLQYKIDTLKVTSTSDYSLLQQASQNWITSYTSNYEIVIKTLTHNPSVIPLQAQILNSYHSSPSENRNVMTQMIPGNYSDQLTYSISF